MGFFDTRDHQPVGAAALTAAAARTTAFTTAATISSYASADTTAAALTAARTTAFAARLATLQCYPLGRCHILAPWHALHTD